MEKSFNAGWEKKSVNDITNSVKNIGGSDVKIVKTITDDNRSYHISSKKLKIFFGF